MRGLRTKSCVFLLGTGSPASLVRERVWNDMLVSGAVSSDSQAPMQSRRWGGFHEKPPTTGTKVQRNVFLGRKRAISCESSEHTSVQAAVWAHIVPYSIRSYDLLMERDSWDHFPVRRYKETNEDETAVTFTAQDEGSVAGGHPFEKMG